MADFTGTSPCQVLDTLASFELRIMERLNRKFFALQRLAQLLEQLGDITELVPNIGALLPVGAISVSDYTAMQQNCPFLNLPPFSEESLVQLKFKIIAAYAALISRLNNHPYFRLDKVQDSLNRFQAEINAGAGIIENALLCLQSICNFAQNTSSALYGVATADIQKQLSLYTQNYVENAGEVLTEGMKAKRDEAQTAVDTIKELMVLT